MSEVCIAALASHFDSPHTVARVHDLFHRLSFDRLRVARPAAAGVVLVLGREELDVTTNAAIDPRALLVPVGPAEGAFGSALPGHRVLLGVQLGAVFFVSAGIGHVVTHRREHAR